MPGAAGAGPDAWYLQSADGKSFGPIPKAQLDGWVLEGLVSAGDFVLQHGDQQWRNARDVYPLLGGASGGFNPAGNFGGAGGGFPSFDSGGGSSSTTGTRKQKRPHRGPLILTLGLVGFFSCFPLAIAAWVMGADDLKQMRAGRMDRSGEGATTIGVVMGMISTGLAVVTILVYLVIFLAFASSVQ
ncbi:MAG: hypothetical protein SFU86_19715 [Pirellulaceae bacterium]|nr:hypothetical protein [Pirellulaceae bacterium]